MRMHAADLEWDSVQAFDVKWDAVHAVGHLPRTLARAREHWLQAAVLRTKYTVLTSGFLISSAALAMTAPYMLYLRQQALQSCMDTWLHLIHSCAESACHGAHSAMNFHNQSGLRQAQADCQRAVEERQEAAPFRVLQGVVQAGFRYGAQALHEGLDFVQLRVWQLDEGLPIQRIWDGLQPGCQSPLAIHCRQQLRVIMLKPSDRSFIKLTNSACSSILPISADSLSHQ